MGKIIPPKLTKFVFSAIPVEYLTYAMMAAVVVPSERVMSEKLVIGNWKMNGSAKLVDEFSASEFPGNVIVAVPFPFLAYAKSIEPTLKLAAQDCSTLDGFGAYTGEVSAAMLKEVGCEAVILGHSERRRLSVADTPENILRKLGNVIGSGMTAVLCVDEEYEKLLDAETLALVKEHPDSIILAYEPLSAIGTGSALTLPEISTALRALSTKCPGTIMLYGGSVTPQNAEGILSLPEVSGVLVGGASLKLEAFKSIAEKAGAV